MIYLKSISDVDDIEDYLGHRLSEFLKAFPQEEHAAVSRSFAEHDSVTPLFIPVENLDGTAEAIAAGREVAKLFPLSSGEKVIAEELYALPYHGLELDGLHLHFRQSTNFAQTFFEIPNYVIRGASVVAFDRDVEPSQDFAEPLVEPAVVPVWALGLAKALASKLLETGGAYIWDIVRKEVLGQTGLPNYYQEVYEEIRRIIAFAFDQHYIKEIRDLAYKFDMTMQHYNSMGRSEHDFLIVKDTSFDLITKSDRLGIPGAFHFSEATVLHMMTLKEGHKRLVEAGSSPEQLERSKKYISEMATQFSKNIIIKRNNLLMERMAKISNKPYFLYGPSWSPQPGRKIGGVHEGAYRYDGLRRVPPDAVGPGNMFEDKENKFWVKMGFNWAREIGSPKHSWTWVNNKLKSYKEAVHNNVVHQTRPMLEISQQLQQLAEKPV